MEQTDVKQAVLEMLADIRPEFDYTASENFVEDGMLDSFDIITLISMLEEKYEIEIDGLDIVPENFFTADSIARLVKKSGGGM